MFASPWEIHIKTVTRVFAAPSIILKSSGSVGITFVMWILGAVAAAAGTAVYIEFGTVRHTLRLLDTVANIALV